VSPFNLTERFWYRIEHDVAVAVNSRRNDASARPDAKDTTGSDPLALPGDRPAMERIGACARAMGAVESDPESVTFA
jgi:hypothetical protein